MTNEQLERLLQEIRLIHTGPVFGEGARPRGLEALTIAVAGKGSNDSVCTQLDGIRVEISDVREAIESLNDTLHKIWQDM